MDKIEYLRTRKTRITVAPTPEEGRALDSIVAVSVDESALDGLADRDRLTCRVVATFAENAYYVVTDWCGLAFFTTVEAWGRRRYRIETPDGPATVFRAEFSVLAIESRQACYGRRHYRIPSPTDEPMRQLARLKGKARTNAPKPPARLYAC